MQLRSGHRDLNGAQERPLTPHFIVAAAYGAVVQKVRSVTELCSLRVSVETYMAPKAPLQCKRCEHFGHTQCSCGYAPRCVAYGEAYLNLCSSLNFAVAGVNTEPIIEAAPSGRRPTQHLQVRQTKRRQTSGATGRPAELKPNRVGLTADQVYLDPSWNHVVQRGRVSKITPSSPEPNPGRSQKFLNGKVTAPKKRLSLPTQYSQLRRPSGRLQ